MIILYASRNRAENQVSLPVERHKLFFTMFCFSKWFVLISLWPKQREKYWKNRFPRKHAAQPLEETKEFPVLELHPNRRHIILTVRENHVLIRAVIFHFWSYKEEKFSTHGSKKSAAIYKRCQLQQMACTKDLTF